MLQTMLNLTNVLTISCHGGALGPRRVLILLAEDFDIAMTELEDLLAELSAALATWLCDGVMKQQQAPHETEENQQYTQSMRHAPSQQTTQHCNAAELPGPVLRGRGWRQV